MRKARWGRDGLVAQKHIGQNADETVAKLAAKHPERFARLFEFHPSGSIKIGSSGQRHAAYSLLYARAAEGASIQDLEAQKTALSANMKSAQHEQLGWIGNAEMLDLEDDDPSPMDKLSDKFKNQLNEIKNNSATSVTHKYLPQAKRKYIGWTNRNHKANRTNSKYTRDLRDKANQLATTFPDHHRYLTKELGLTSDEASYMMVHIEHRLPQLRTPTQSKDGGTPSVGENKPRQRRLSQQFSSVKSPIKDQREQRARRLSEPVDPDSQEGLAVRNQFESRYDGKFTGQVKKMMAAKNYENMSDFAGRPRQYKREPDIRDKRLDQTRAMLYAAALAHPEKVDSGELQYFEQEIPTFRSKNLADLNGVVNKNDQLGKDELFDRIKGFADINNQQRGIQ